jgi:hypothetical protein
VLTQNVYAVGTAAVTVVAPTIDSARYILKNLEPGASIGELARDGYIYAVNQYLQIANNGTAIFSFTTGSSGAQFEYWKFDSSASSILASLIEGATITTNATVPAYNLNRNESDTYDSVLQSATALTGGTVIYSDYVGASNQSTGGASNSMPITLEPNTQYGFRFQNVGNSNTNVHISIGFAEKYNGYNQIWLGTVDDSYVLSGGEEVSMYLRPQETINAIALRDDCKLAVMRQD